jgi:glycosyltransferase involved in cell wall biosynthesis
LNSCQPSIHDRLKLIERLQQDQTAWEWELTEVDSPYEFYINTDKLIIDIGYYEDRKPWGIVQGKWASEVEEIFNKENIKIDYNERGFIDKSYLKLSIIIPYYKTLQLTENLMEVLLPQLTPEVEVILIDDGCNETHLDKLPIKVIHQKNGGVCKARNVGIDNAKGKYIAFIDSDDLISKDYIQKILNKIDTETFDYCYMSWEAIGTSKEKFIIRDIPLAWNTAVWKCIYKRTMIGKTRFNEKIQIAEEKGFNTKCVKGKRANIEDILYYYNNGRQGSLINRYSKGEIERVEDVSSKEVITAQVIIYRSYLSLIGGIETAIYNACNMLKDKYNVMFIYDSADENQITRLSKLVQCVQITNQNFICKTFINYGLNPQTPCHIQSEQYVQQICCDMIAVNYYYTPQAHITKYTADSQGSADTLNELFPHLNCTVLHNLFDLPKPKKMLHLMTASRLSWEKGYGRMKSMAKRMIEKGIPFIWTVFTNEKPDEDIDGMIFMKPRLNVQDYMLGQDYGLQLSNTESWGCTITEFLERGTPVICTNYRSSKEQVDDGVNGYILDLDLKNLDEVIDNMYNNNLKGFKYIKKDNIKEWTDLIGNYKKEKCKYVKPKGTAVRSLFDVAFSEEQVNARVGTIFYIQREERLNYLLGANPNNTKYVEKVE